MKIFNRPTEQSGVRGKKSSTDPSGRTERKSSLFEEMLLGVGDAKALEGIPVSSEFIQEGMALIDELGRQLERAPSMKTFLSYRSSVQKLLSRVVPHSLGISKTLSPVNLKTLEAKEYHTVQVLNDELLSLLSLVREKEMKNFDVASRVVRIKGLIIDVLK